MSREAGEWNKATRYGKAGGLHIYIPKEEVEKALLAAEIPAEAQRLVVKSSWFKTSSKGTGRLIVQVRLEPQKGE